ncbi:MAG: beta tubulin [Rhizobiales bacterium 65-9]|nr:MAG: beta tubulin [Rhizobiales bacterium 65-9]
MRTLPDGLAAHVAGEATTVCQCWRLTLADGTRLGFTDHDRDLAFDGTLFEAASGLSASEAVSEAGFSTGGLEVAGALRSDRIAAHDLAIGRFDHAAVEVFTVNWQAPDERILLRAGHVGEVVSEDGAFRAEIRGPAAALDEPGGRFFRSACDADLGDARCGVDLSSPAYAATATVLAATDARLFAVSGLGAFASAWFERGRARFTSGANAGFAAAIKMQRVVEGSMSIALWSAAPFPIAPGDTLALTAGCDKRFSTCRDRFGNAANFRGFPHMPGNDFTLGYARSGSHNDGSPVG